mmetsp:Transcript_17700/g.38710  ORF Transcript_17700/g.38710 Transcript_17700/m.38710 type:complete len:584 (+) Transcript_17700:2120-3871(+)
MYYNQSSKQEDDAGTKLVPAYLLTILLVSCIFGTFSWLILATDGRIIAPLFKLLGVEGISTGYVLLITVLLEDIPQVVLTFLIDDYFESDTVSSLAMFNLCTSLYDTMIKIAEAYDERNDIVETGAWMKQTYRGHRGCVSAAVALPFSAFQSPDRTPSFTSGAGIVKGTLWRNTRSRTEAKDNSPYFLSASHDGTVRLWDPSSTHTMRKSYIRKFKCHRDWVTCVVVLGSIIGYTPPAAHEKDKDDLMALNSETMSTNNGEDEDNSDDNVVDIDKDSVFFLTGSRDGTIKLYNVASEKRCVRTYTSDCPVTCLASLDHVSGSHFVSGHSNSAARLWDTITGECLQVFSGHEKLITSVCSLKDGSIFLTASDDATIKAWDARESEVKPTTDAATESGWNSASSLPSTGSFGESKHCSGLVVWDVRTPGEIREQSAAEEKECIRSFVGHRGSVFCVATVEEGATFVSGGGDRRLKLWDYSSGLCLRNFVGHTATVSAVCVFDDSTVLSGSFDKSARMWDIDAGVCLRVFEHHSDIITSIASCGNGWTFLTTSKDSTIKLWVATNAASSMQQLMEDTELESTMEYA